ncbi:MAG: hypothetical protein KBB83_03190 [Alphaproteobacteria bacterium]|nr:hypothetical protein [Alphaproteobacteria bacterium]
MITINKYFYNFILCLLLSTSALASNNYIDATASSTIASAASNTEVVYNEECAYIDGFLEQEVFSKEDKQQMDPSIEALWGYSMAYVMQHRLEGRDFCKKVMGLKRTTDLLDADWFSAMSETDKFIAICLSEALLAATSPEPTRIKKQNMARATSLLLTPEFAQTAVRQKWIKHPYPLARITAEYADRILDLQRRKLEEEYDDHSSSKLEWEAEGTLFSTCYMFNECSAYQLKTFFYALSKGVILEGISPTRFTGHGCLFPFTLLAQSHDQAHAEELKGENTFGRGSRFAVVTLKNFASQFLDILNEGQVFPSNEADLALLAAFMMVHETQTKAFIEPCLTDLIISTNIDLGKLSASIAHKLGYEEYKADYPQNFIYRFYSDMAFELIKVKPELTEVLFPQGTEIVQKELLQEDDFNSNKPLSYNLDQTIEESVKLMSWFMGKFSPHLKAIRVSNN